MQQQAEEKSVQCFGQTAWKETPFETSNHGWEDNIKMCLQQVGCEGADWIHLAQNIN